MSEYEKNGGNYPDKGGTWSGPVSDDKDREAGTDTAAPAAGGINADVTTGGGAGGTGTQDGPLEDMHTTTVDEKIEGIIAQCRSDYAGSPEHGPGAAGAAAPRGCRHLGVRRRHPARGHPRRQCRRRHPRRAGAHPER